MAWTVDPIDARMMWPRTCKHLLAHPDTTHRRTNEHARCDYLSDDTRRRRRVSDCGIDDRFVKELSETMQPCCSSLFVLIRSMTTDKVFDELRGIGGEIISTSLSKDIEARLRTTIQGSSA